MHLQIQNLSLSCVNLEGNGSMFTHKTYYDILKNIKNLSQQYYSNSYATPESAQKNLTWVESFRSKLNIPFSQDKKILDVACGVSMLGKTFSNDVFGFDVNKEAVKVAQKNGIKAKIGNVERKWQYPDNFFDIVIASHIIEHVVNPDHLILEAKRVLKKNGLLIIATPNIAAWFNRILILAGIQPFFSEVSTIDKTLGLKFTRRLSSLRNPLGHLRLFTLGSLRDILELHGFKVAKMSSTEFGSFPPVLGFIDKIISHNASLASGIVIVGKKK